MNEFIVPFRLFTGENLSAYQFQTEHSRSRIEFIAFELDGPVSVPSDGDVVFMFVFNEIIQTISFNDASKTMQRKFWIDFRISFETKCDRTEIESACVKTKYGLPSRQQIVFSVEYWLN